MSAGYKRHLYINLMSELVGLDTYLAGYPTGYLAHPLSEKLHIFCVDFNWFAAIERNRPC